MIVAVTHPFDKQSKSRTSLHLAQKMAHDGHRVLLIDLTCNSFLTRELGFQHLTRSMLDVMDGSIALDDIIIGRENYAFAPAGFTLKLIDISLGWSSDRNLRLKAALNDLETEFDAIIIDCDSSFSFLTINALTACDIAVLPAFSEQNLNNAATAIHLLGCEEIMEQKAHRIDNTTDVFSQLSEQLNSGRKLLILEQPIWTQNYLLPKFATIAEEDLPPVATENLQDFTLYLN
ncbi:MAG: ParA family protein [Bacteroidota bacterium]